MAKTYDAIIIPTGETNGGDRSFPVSKEAISIFRAGKAGCIFVTGGCGGFVNEIPQKLEAEDTADHLIENGIPESRVYHDSRSFETLGGFALPIVRPKISNPSLYGFKRMLIVGKKGHIWRIRDCANLIFPRDRELEYLSVPGRHNDGLLTRIYHKALMHVLKDLKENPNADEAHNFLVERHPIYSEGWFGKSIGRRKAEMALRGLSWLL